MIYGFSISILSSKLNGCENYLRLLIYFATTGINSHSVVTSGPLHKLNKGCTCLDLQIIGAILFISK